MSFAHSVAQRSRSYQGLGYSLQSIVCILPSGTQILSHICVQKCLLVCNVVVDEGP